MKNLKPMAKMKMLRKKNNMTQAQLAESIGIIQQNYRLYEVGERELPVRFAKKLGKSLNVNWWELYED